MLMHKALSVNRSAGPGPGIRPPGQAATTASTRARGFNLPALVADLLSLAARLATRVS